MCAGQAALMVPQHNNSTIVAAAYSAHKTACWGGRVGVVGLLGVGVRVGVGVVSCFVVDLCRRRTWYWSCARVYLLCRSAWQTKRGARAWLMFSSCHRQLAIACLQRRTTEFMHARGGDDAQQILVIGCHCTISSHSSEAPREHKPICLTRPSCLVS